MSFGAGLSSPAAAPATETLLHHPPKPCTVTTWEHLLSLPGIGSSVDLFLLDEPLQVLGALHRMLNDDTLRRAREQARWACFIRTYSAACKALPPSVEILLGYVNPVMQSFWKRVDAIELFERTREGGADDPAAAGFVHPAFNLKDSGVHMPRPYRYCWSCGVAVHPRAAVVCKARHWFARELQCTLGVALSCNRMECQRDAEKNMQTSAERWREDHPRYGKLTVSFY